jgi:predicted transcriptional regulator
MARPAAKTLTDAELRIMRVLWRNGEATIADLCGALRPEPARATVQTMLRIMERKRYVKHRADGRSFVYRPIVDESAASERAVKQVLTNFFPRTQGALVMRLLNAKDLTKESIDRVRRILDEDER